MQNLQRSHVNVPIIRPFQQNNTLGNIGKNK